MNPFKRADDLRKVDLPQCDWRDPRRALGEIRDHCLEQAKDAERWYMEQRGSKRFWGRVLRVSSILLVGVAAVLPILAELWLSHGEPRIPPAWASVALVLAALLAALDKYFGFSTSWARFMATDLEIERLRHGFEFEWQTLEAETGGSGVDPAALLDLAREFVLAVDDAVAGETLIWSVEFKASLDTAAKEVKAGA